MAYFGHIEDAQKGCSLLRSTAGVKDDEGLLGQDADAAAVLHSGKTRQNGLIGDLKALAPEGQRQLDRDGGMIDSDELYDSSDEKGTLRGSIAATLQKKLVVNTTGVLFDLLGKCGDRTAITAAGDYLSTALYTLLRHLYRCGGGNEDFFATAAVDFDAGVIDAAMLRSRAAYLRALSAAEKLPELTSDDLTAAPGVGQSTAQVVHNVDELAGRQ